MGVQLPQERRKREYNQALIERYRNVEEVRKVKKSLHVPKPIYKVSSFAASLKFHGMVLGTKNTTNN